MTLARREVNRLLADRMRFRCTFEQGNRMDCCSTPVSGLGGFGGEMLNILHRDGLFRGFVARFMDILYVVIDRLQW